MKDLTQLRSAYEKLKRSFNANSMDKEEIDRNTNDVFFRLQEIEIPLETEASLSSIRKDILQIHVSNFGINENFDKNIRKIIFDTHHFILQYDRMVLQNLHNENGYTKS